MFTLGARANANANFKVFSKHSDLLKTVLELVEDKAEKGLSTERRIERKKENKQGEKREGKGRITSSSLLQINRMTTFFKYLVATVKDHKTKIFAVHQVKKRNYYIVMISCSIV